MPDRTQLYCRGLPLREIRRLTDEELAELRESTGAIVRWHRRERLLRNGIGILAGSIAVWFAVAWPDPESIGLTIGAAFAVFMAMLIPGASLCAFVFPRSPVERLFFGVPVVSTVVLAATVPFDLLPGGVITALACAAFLPGMIAIAVWVLRGLDGRRTASALSTLPLDIEVGEVLVFEAEGEPNTDALVQIERHMEVLPRSRLKYQPGSARAWEWSRVHVEQVATPPENPREWTSRSDEELGLDDDRHWYRRRGLLPAEMAELRRLVRRIPKRATAELIGVFLAAVVLIQLVQYLLWASDTVLDIEVVEARVASAAWFAVVLIVLGRGVRLILDWRAWRADLDCGEVLRVRPAGQSPLRAEVLVELLPESGIVWTEAGKPAPWRHRPPR
jgi:hypothetical protein